MFEFYGFSNKRARNSMVIHTTSITKVNHGLDKYDNVLVLLRALLLPLLLRDMILLC